MTARSPVGPEADPRVDFDLVGPDDADRRGAKALVTARDRVLLIKEQRSDGSTFWTLPGGGLEAGETPEDGLARELIEELRVGIDIAAYVGWCRYHHRSTPDTVSVYAIFTGSMTGVPFPNRTAGVLTADWFDPEDLPADVLVPIREVIRSARSPGPVTEPTVRD